MRGYFGSNRLPLFKMGGCMSEPSSTQPWNHFNLGIASSPGQRPSTKSCFATDFNWLFKSD